ncbi:MAG: ABC transporter ATP-binding protein [Proteobacteria bacterium]|jgi:ABC-2 type transport system ATP-binding protein|nr:ABC transporter ATP-binding protein [Pseudomonadota bacterium]MDA1301197.1 ABC transporter ATP-binding protein [Pseudomonadota bacterium]
MTVVSAHNMNKRFGDVWAMREVSFDIAEGSVVGLIGPNGAGKTTTLKAILGLTGFDGRLAVMGYDPRVSRDRVMEQVCFIADVGILPRWLRVSEVIEYVAGVHHRFDRKRALQLLAETDIKPRHRVRQLSKGMVTQLHLAVVMSIDVDLLVLDEPTIGLDILYRKAFYDRLLDDYFERNMSIIISTHQVEEVESLLTHLLFINAGEIVLDSAMASLADTYTELLVAPDHVDRAVALGPIHIRDVIGKKRCIFEGVARDRLVGLGEVSVPSVSDLFIAKLAGKSRTAGIGEVS